MVNLKHALSAIAAVAMVGSLAANQASNITPVNAEQKSTIDIQFSQPAILAGDGKGIVLDQLPKPTVAAPQETKAPEDKKGYVNITEGYLNLRAEASTDAEAIAQLECAAEVTILSEENDWYCVQYGDKTGYVSKQYITNSYEEAKAAMLENFKFESGYINAEGVNIRDGFGTDGTNVIDQASKGDLAFVIADNGDGWLKVYYGKNYDVGYVKSEFVTIDDAVSKDDVLAAKANRINSIVTKGIVSSNGAQLNVRVLPDDNAQVIEVLNDGDAVNIISKGSNWTKIAVGNSGSTAYVKSEFVLDQDQIAARDNAKKQEQLKKEQAAQAKITKTTTKTAAKTTTKTADSTTKKAATAVAATSSGSGSGQSIVNEAKKHIGTRYVYGGTSPSTGFDCSGLVQYSCRQVGISVSRSSGAQYSNGVAVSKSDLQPGDLIFFSKGAGISHVVIYAGNGQVIHSPSPGKSVTYASLSTICSYSTYVGARRVA